MNAREAGELAGIIIDNQRVSPGQGVAAGVVPVLRRGFVHPVVIAVHVVVVARSGGGDGELRAAGGSLVVGLERDDEVIFGFFILIGADVAGPGAAGSPASMEAEPLSRGMVWVEPETTRSVLP